jgi:hypothetical protein
MYVVLLLPLFERPERLRTFSMARKRMTAQGHERDFTGTSLSWDCPIAKLSHVL